MRRAIAAHVVTCVLIGIVSAPAAVEAQEGWLQLEGHLFSRPGARVGARLGERAAVLTGVSARFDDIEWNGTSEHRGEWSIPLEAKLYFADADPGTIVPLVLLGAAYGRAVWKLDYGAGVHPPTQELATHTLTAYWLVGVDYVISSVLAIELSAGASYYRSWSDDEPFAGLGGLGGLGGVSSGRAQRGWGIDWRLGVVVRP